MWNACCLQWDKNLRIERHRAELPRWLASLVPFEICNLRGRLLDLVQLHDPMPYKPRDKVSVYDDCVESAGR